MQQNNNPEKIIHAPLESKEKTPEAIEETKADLIKLSSEIERSQLISPEELANDYQIDISPETLAKTAESDQRLIKKAFEIAKKTLD
ncbi:hypothetical protein GF376_02865 [Candidatus Peregrinibacteria bacterium]|nr:hypothetical protein [Candidatus Peregrinibacteria bacterium]